MARLRFDGLNELMADLNHFGGDLPLNDMLDAGADVAVEAQMKNAPYKDGTLQKSIKKGKPRRFLNGAYIEVKPTGTHHKTKGTSKAGKSGNTGKKRGSTGKTVTNMEVAFIHEFGAPSRNIPARQWIAKANETAANDIEAAELKAYDESLKRHNL